MIEKNKIFRGIALRLRLNRFINSFVVALLWTSIFGFLFLFLSKLFSFNLYIVTVLWIALIISFFYTLIDFFIMKQSAIQVALTIDKKLGLKERISSAILLEESDNIFIEALLSDAQKSLSNINSHNAFPIKFPRLAPYIFLPVIISLLVYSLLPDYDLLKLNKKRELKEAIKSTIVTEAKKLEKKSLDLEKKIGEIKAPELKKAITEIKKLSKDLQNQKITKKEAMLKVSELSEKMQKAKEQIASDKKLSNNINQTASFDKLRKLASEFKKKDYESASKTLSELSKKLENKEISQEDLSKIANELSKLSDLMGSENPLKESLQKVAEHLNKDELQKALQELNKALDESSNMGLQAQKDAGELQKLSEALKDSQMMIAMAGSQEANLASISMSEKSESTGMGMKGSSSEMTSEDSRMSGPEAGIGTTNEESEFYEVQKGHTTKDRFSKSQSQWQEEFIRMYKPERFGGLHTKDEFIRGDVKLEKGMKEITAPLEPTTVKPKAELKNVLADFTESQKESIEREEIPNYYKRCVQNYFDSIH